jgi:hypothetical protein
MKGGCLFYLRQKRQIHEENQTSRLKTPPYPQHHQQSLASISILSKKKENNHRDNVHTRQKRLGRGQGAWKKWNQPDKLLERRSSCISTILPSKIHSKLEKSNRKRQLQTAAQGPTPLILTTAESNRGLPFSGDDSLHVQRTGGVPIARSLQCVPTNRERIYHGNAGTSVGSRIKDVVEGNFAQRMQGALSVTKTGEFSPSQIGCFCFAPSVMS